MTLMEPITPVVNQPDFAFSNGFSAGFSTLEANAFALTPDRVVTKLHSGFSGVGRSHYLPMYRATIITGKTGTAKPEFPFVETIGQFDVYEDGAMQVRIFPASEASGEDLDVDFTISLEQATEPPGDNIDDANFTEVGFARSAGSYPIRASFDIDGSWNTVRVLLKTDAYRGATTRFRYMGEIWVPFWDREEFMTRHFSTPAAEGPGVPYAHTELFINTDIQREFL